MVWVLSGFASYTKLLTSRVRETRSAPRFKRSITDWGPVSQKTAYVSEGDRCGMKIGQILTPSKRGHAKGKHDSVIHDVLTPPLGRVADEGKELSACGYGVAP